jgi:hypothetical protein
MALLLKPWVALSVRHKKSGAWIIPSGHAAAEEHHVVLVFARSRPCRIGYRAAKAKIDDMVKAGVAKWVQVTLVESE